MKTKDVIESGYLSFYSLIKVIKKPINFEKLQDHQYKGVLEGRYEAFIIAGSQLNQIKDLEEQGAIFSQKKFNEKIKILIDSTDDILTEINEVLKKDIKVKEIEEEKFKAVVQSKKVAFNFLLEIKSKKNDMEYILENANSTRRLSSGNFATDRVKREQ